MKNTLFLLLIGFMTISLGACGVKPSHVKPPEGAQETPFPRTYPHPTGSSY